MSNLLRRLLLIFAVVISGALCTVEDYVIMSQCAHNKAIHLAAEGTVSVTDISQTQNITILGLPDFVNNAFKIALYAKETQRYLCFSENWRLVALKELQNTCYFNETIVHGYFVFRSVLDLQRRIGFTHRGKAVGPKKNVNDACYLFTKIQANEFFHQHNNYFAHKTTTAASAALGAPASTASATTMMAKAVTLPSNRLKAQRNKNKRRNNNKNNNNNNNSSSSSSNNNKNSSNNNQNLHKLNGHNSNISSNLSSNKQQQQQQQKQPQQPQQEHQNEKLVLEKEKPNNKSHKHHHDHHDHDHQHQHQHKHHHHHHNHHQKHHLVRHHHNNPDVIARRHQHEQKQKRRPHNRLRMLEKTTPAATPTSTSTAVAIAVANQPQIQKVSTTSTTTSSKRTQTAFSPSTLATTAIRKTITTTTMMPKVTRNNGKGLMKMLLPTTSSTSSLSISTSSTHRTTTPTTSKRKGRRRKHKKHTHKQQKLIRQQQQHHLLEPTQQPADHQQPFITEENEKSFSLSSLAATTWSDFTSIASFLDDATSYYGNEWLSSSSDEMLAVSPTAMHSSSSEIFETPTKSTESDNELTSYYSSQTPLDDAYTTTNSIRNRKKTTATSSSTSLSTPEKEENEGEGEGEGEGKEEAGKEGLSDASEPTLNGMLSFSTSTVALPKIKSTIAHQTKVNFKRHETAATTAITTSTTATNTSTKNKVSYAKSHIEPDTINVTAMGETLTATTPISNIISKEAANTFAASTPMRQHDVTPTQMSNTVIDVNLKKWLTNVKVNQSNANININNTKNILRNSMTELINSTRSSNANGSENGTFSGYQNDSLQQYQSEAPQHTDHDVELNAKKPIVTPLNNNTLTTTLATNGIVFKPQEVVSTTLSPLLQLFSPYYIAKNNNLLDIEKNINNGNINNSILEDRTPTPTATTKASTTATATKSNAQDQYNTITTQKSLSTTPVSVSSTAFVVPSLKKTIRKSTQKLLATPFHQLTTYVRNEAGDIDIDNIDNISVYPDIMESETFTDNAAQLKKHQNSDNNSNNTNSRLIVVSGYLPTSASAVLPESIQIAKIKINNERQRLWPQRFVGNAA